MVKAHSHELHLKHAAAVDSCVSAADTACVNEPLDDFESNLLDNDRHC